jgi:acyl dehydratase
VSFAVGDSIPEWVMESVSPERMCTMAAILRDPNPIHWDRNAVDALPLGLGKRTINQGPLGLSYMINMPGRDRTACAASSCPFPRWCSMASEL